MTLSSPTQSVVPSTPPTFPYQGSMEALRLVWKTLPGDDASTRRGPALDLEREVDYDYDFCLRADARLRSLSRFERSLDRERIRALRTLYDAYDEDNLGYSHRCDFAREELDISKRTWQMYKNLDQELENLPRTDEVLASGAIPVMRVRTLLPVLNRDNEEIWLRRARRFTVRELREMVQVARRTDPASGNGGTRSRSGSGSTRSRSRPSSGTSSRSSSDVDAATSAVRGGEGESRSGEGAVAGSPSPLSGSSTGSSSGSLSRSSSCSSFGSSSGSSSGSLSGSLSGSSSASPPHRSSDTAEGTATSGETTDVPFMRMRRREPVRERLFWKGTMEEVRRRRGGPVAEWQVLDTLLAEFWSRVPPETQQRIQPNPTAPPYWQAQSEDTACFVVVPKGDANRPARPSKIGPDVAESDSGSSGISSDSGTSSDSGSSPGSSSGSDSGPDSGPAGSRDDRTAPRNDARPHSRAFILPPLEWNELRRRQQDRERRLLEKAFDRWRALDIEQARRGIDTPECPFETELQQLRDAQRATDGPPTIHDLLDLYQTIQRLLRRVTLEQGTILQTLRDRHLTRPMGFESFGHFTQERLGLPRRTAEHRADVYAWTARVTTLRQAYLDGSIAEGQLKELRLLWPFASPDPKCLQRWIERARHTSVDEFERQVQYVEARTLNTRYCPDPTMHERSNNPPTTVEWRAAEPHMLRQPEALTLTRVHDEIRRQVFSHAAAGGRAEDGLALDEQAAPNDQAASNEQTEDGSASKEQAENRATPNERAVDDSATGNVRMTASSAASPASKPAGANDLQPFERDAADLCPDPDVVCNRSAWICAPLHVLESYHRALALLRARYGQDKPSWWCRRVLVLLVRREWIGSDEDQRRRTTYYDIYARDGWQCRNPVCTSRCNLMAHHIEFGHGKRVEAPWNLITLCAACHLHGIHEAGSIRVTGRAPHQLRWEIGRNRDGSPRRVFAT